MRKEDLLRCDDIVILAESREAGVFLAMSRNGRRIYVMGHPEYDRQTKAVMVPIGKP